jgi:SRSO17 transposase
MVLACDARVWLIFLLVWLTVLGRLRRIAAVKQYNAQMMSRKRHWRTVPLMRHHGCCGSLQFKLSPCTCQQHGWFFHAMIVGTGC